MNAIEFIEKDVARARQGNAQRLGWPVLFGLLPVALGLGARRDLIEVSLAQNLIPGLLVVLSIGGFVWAFARGSRKKSGVAVLFVIAGIASFGQPYTEFSVSKFQDPARFWPENLHCFLLGAAIGGLMTVLLSAVLALRFPSPNRIWQYGIAFASGLTGVAALTFHCMGAWKSHILIAHWGQALLIGVLSFAFQRLLFLSRIRSALGSASSLRDLSSIDL